jgi:hypothetical protein
MIPQRFRLDRIKTATYREWRIAGGPLFALVILNMRLWLNYDRQRETVPVSRSTPLCAQFSGFRRPGNKSVTSRFSCLPLYRCCKLNCDRAACGLTTCVSSHIRAGKLQRINNRPRQSVESIGSPGSRRSTITVYKLRVRPVVVVALSFRRRDVQRYRKARTFAARTNSSPRNTPVAPGR